MVLLKFCHMCQIFNCQTSLVKDLVLQLTIALELKGEIRH